MKKNKNKKKFLFIGIIIIFFILLYILTIKKGNYSNIEKITHEIGTYFESIFIPKEITISDEITNGINKELESELNELKKTLELNETEYKFIHANVIKRDNNWYQKITINKGEKDNIKPDMAVISNNCLIGRVIKTTNSSSVIKLLTASSNDMKISVTVKSKDNSFNGIIDDYLESENLIQINNILKTANIEIGDKVYTNGLGGIYPSGIYVGKVASINEDKLGISKILKVSTDTQYDNIRFVSVIDRSNK